MTRRPFTIFTGPWSMVAECNSCNHVETVERPRKPGKAWGWTSRNHLTKRMNQHLRDKHPERLAK